MRKEKSKSEGLNPLKQVKSFGLDDNWVWEFNSRYGLNPLKQVKSFGRNLICSSVAIA